MQCAVGQFRPEGADGRGEFLNFGSVHRKIDVLDPFDIGAEFRPSDEIEGQVDPKTRCFGQRID